MEPERDGRLSGWLTAVKGLTITNVLVIFLLALIAAPGYVVYKAVNDPAVMDRLLSTYREYPTQAGCTLREVQQRGGQKLWGMSAGFAFQGSDRWAVQVVLDHEPTQEERDSYCASLKLLVDSWVNINEASP